MAIAIRKSVLILAAIGAVCSTAVTDENTRFGVHTSTTDIDRLAAWQDWTAERATVVGENLFAQTWEDLRGKNPNGGTGFTLNQWKRGLSRYRGEVDRDEFVMEFALPVFPTRESRSSPDYSSISEKWAQGAAGEFDRYFVDLARALVRSGWGNAYLRPAWEFNLPSSVTLWGLRDLPDQWAYFPEYWQRIHRAMMSVEGADFQWVWCVLLDGDTSSYDPRAVNWPGDEYVDIVSVDLYDNSGLLYYQRYREEPKFSWETLRKWNWDRLQTGERRHPYSGEVEAGKNILSLDSMYEFARQKGKPFAISEWGIDNGALFPEATSFGGNDNPDFIKNVAGWIYEREVLYAIYFEMFLVSKEFGFVNHSILPNYWSESRQGSDFALPWKVANPLSSTQYLRSFMKRGASFPQKKRIFWSGDDDSQTDPWIVKNGCEQLGAAYRLESTDQKSATLEAELPDWEILTVELSQPGAGSTSIEIESAMLNFTPTESGHLGAVNVRKADGNVANVKVPSRYKIGSTYVPFTFWKNDDRISIQVGRENLDTTFPVETEIDKTLRISNSSGAVTYLRRVSYQ